MGLRKQPVPDEWSGHAPVCCIGQLKRPGRGTHRPGNRPEQHRRKSAIPLTTCGSRMKRNPHPPPGPWRAGRKQMKSDPGRNGKGWGFNPSHRPGWRRGRGGALAWMSGVESRDQFPGAQEAMPLPRCFSAQLTQKVEQFPSTNGEGQRASVLKTFSPNFEVQKNFVPKIRAL